MTGNLSHRSFLKSTAAVGLSCAAELGGIARAAAETINFATWSAAADTVKSHLAAFEAKTGIKVNYSNLPWAQYSETMITQRRGIQEASADLIIFVDDDNVLDDKYLAEAIKIGQEWPSLGAWGTGCIRGDFEVEPPVNLTKHRPWWREVPTPRWSNVASCEDAVPWCVGLCLRKEVGMAYSQFCDQSSIQITSRQGASLFGGEHIEISFVCCNHGLGIGIFPELKLTHLIPKGRLSEDYLVRMMEDSSLSGLLLYYKWQHIIPQSPFSIKTLLSVLKTILLYRGVDRDIRFAWVRALIKANKIIKMDLRKNKWSNLRAWQRARRHYARAQRFGGLSAGVVEQPRRDPIGQPPAVDAGRPS
jgi:hypothetical protein